MNMLRHDHESQKQEFLSNSNPIKLFQENIASMCRCEKGKSSIAAKCEEVEIPLTVVLLEWIVHSSQNTHP